MPSAPVEAQIADAVTRVGLEYNEALSTAGQDSDRQIVAEQKKRQQLSRLAQHYYRQLDSIQSASELLSLATAFEAAQQPTEAQAVNDRLLSLHPDHPKGHALRIRHHINHASANQGLASLEKASEILAAQPMRPLLPYWGALGFKFARESQHKKSLSCFKRYLDSRYNLAQTSIEPLPVLHVILRKLRYQYLALGDRASYQQYLKHCRQRLNETAVAWHSKPEPDQESRQRKLVWQLYFQPIRLFLASETKAEDPMLVFRDFLQLAIDQQEFIRDRKDFPRILDEATRLVIGASHRWGRLPTEIDWPNVTSLATPDGAVKPASTFRQLIQAAVTQVHHHSQQMNQWKSITDRLSITPNALPWKALASSKQAGCVVCLADDTPAVLYRIRAQLAELSLRYPVVLYARNDDQQAALAKQLRMLPKPIEKANVPFQTYVLKWPQAWKDIQLPTGEVGWLVVNHSHENRNERENKNENVGGPWIDLADDKIANIHWHLLQTKP